MATTQAGTRNVASTMWWPDTGRATHAVIDLDAIRGNLLAVHRSVAPAGVIAVVKANAYGHGAVMVAEAAVEAGAVMLAVSAVDEGIELRDGGISTGILVMAPAGPAEYAEAFEHGLTLSLAEPEQVLTAARAADGLAQPGGVQIKVDTGMRRYGAEPELVVSLARQVLAHPKLRLTGIYSHFADADGDDPSFTVAQLARFQSVVIELEAAGVEPGLVHCANTAGTIRLSLAGHSAVRLGIGLYGLRPDERVPLLPGMRQALTLRTRVAQIRTLLAGDTVSYGRTYTADRPEITALLPIGYADGLRRAVSGTGWVDINGARASIRGRVCMDQVVVGGCDDSVRTGDPVVVFGDGSDAAPTLSEVARLASTINYEIATGIAQRVPRWYLRDGQPVALLRGSRLLRL